MRILTISGSLRAVSSNTSVLEAVALLAPRDVQVIHYHGVGELPHFNPDLDRDVAPPMVTALRHEIGISAGVLICSPEYAHGVAGSLKNALDWLVSSVEFPGKPIALINAAARATHSDSQLREILRTMSARLIEQASIMLPLRSLPPGASGIVADPELSAALRLAMQNFVDAITATTS